MATWLPQGGVMRTVDQIRMAAPVERVFQAAVDVEQWPALLSHYRWVRMLERREQGGLVEMAAWRPFGLFKYPTWWVSEMRVDRAGLAVHYRHVRGITTGMDVVWQFQPLEGGTDVTIVHEWSGPRWPLIGRGGGGLGHRSGIHPWDRVTDAGGDREACGGGGRA